MAKILKCSRGRANDRLHLCAVVGVFLMLAIPLGGFIASSLDIDGAGGGSYVWYTTIRVETRTVSPLTAV